MSKKVAIIIAGGSGMGADAARKLASEGYNISILSSSGKGEKLAKDLAGIGITGSNLSNNDLEKIFNETFNKWGRVDVLINSAGHGPKGPLLKITDEEWHKAFDIYFMNVVRSVRIVTPIMKKQKSGGVIINISTFAAFEPDSVFPTSGVCRAGLASYTKLFADEYAKDNIRINNILPGFIDSLAEKEEFRSRIPLKRYGKTSEISSVISFLVSDGAAYITGQNIKVDGGITKSL